MRTALYIRVSTDEQAKEGFSIEAQKAFLERKAVEANLTIVKIYLDDGYSAKNMKRPALQQLLKDVQSREFEVVFFWRLDRFTRKSRDFHKLIEVLQKHNAGIKSASEPIDTTSALGRFQLELSVSLAQLERETISERVFFVMEERVRKGIRNGGPAAYGYDLVDGKLTINEAQAKVIKRIFDLYLTGVGMKSIAQTLTREGIAGSYNALWSGAAIKYVLQNPVYIGKLRWNYINKTNKRTKKELVVDGGNESIIDEVTFQRAQNSITQRAKGGKRFNTDFLFSSVLRCGLCGGSMQGNSYKKKEQIYKTYRCSNKIHYSNCESSNMRENGVIEAFLSALDMSEIDLEKYLVIQENEEDDTSDFDDLKKELEAISRRKKKWQIAYGNDLITLEELRDHTEDDRLREEFLKKQLENVAPKIKSHWTREELIQQLKQLREAWHLIDNDKVKKQFIQEAFEYIRIDAAPGSKIGQGFRPKLIITDFMFRT